MSTILTTQLPKANDGCEAVQTNECFYRFHAYVPFGTVVNYTVWCSVPFFKNVGMPRLPGNFYTYIWNVQIKRFFAKLAQKYENKLWQLVVKNKYRRNAFVNMEQYKKDFTNYMIYCPYGLNMNPYWVCHLFINELCRFDANRALVQTNGKFHGIKYQVLPNSKMTIHFTW